MKKIMIMALVAMMAIGVGSAYAKGGMGAGGGMGGAGMKGQGMNLPADFKPATQAQADVAATNYIDSNLKGYEVVSSSTFQGKRFTGYTYTVQDASGNQFNLVVNARGIVRGPFPVKQ
ncbi:MAG: hypothetical protein C0603_01305 [Denitrovibrio sp.]|nr:MAG: hypothetical protein C0603_01305 [Denitrovibrio sp.]